MNRVEMRALILSKYKTLKLFAAKADLSSGFVSSVLSNKLHIRSYCSMATAQRWARLLGIDVNDMEEMIADSDKGKFFMRQ